MKILIVFLLSNLIHLYAFSSQKNTRDHKPNSIKASLVTEDLCYEHTKSFIMLFWCLRQSNLTAERLTFCSINTKTSVSQGICMMNKAFDDKIQSCFTTTTSDLGEQLCILDENFTEDIDSTPVFTDIDQKERALLKLNTLFKNQGILNVEVEYFDVVNFFIFSVGTPKK